MMEVLFLIFTVFLNRLRKIFRKLLVWNSFWFDSLSVAHGAITELEVIKDWAWKAKARTYIKLKKPPKPAFLGCVILILLLTQNPIFLPRKVFSNAKRLGSSILPGLSTFWDFILDPRKSLLGKKEWESTFWTLAESHSVACQNHRWFEGISVSPVW